MNYDIKLCELNGAGEERRKLSDISFKFQLVGFFKGM